MKTLVIFGWYGHGNIGDEAILSVMVSGIKHFNPKVQILVFSENPENVVKWHGVHAIRWRRGRWVPCARNILKSICASDAFVIGGGGLINDYFSGKFFFSWALQYLGMGFIAKVLSKRVMLYGVGVGPIKTRFGRILTKLLANRMNLIAVRDQGSKKLLEELGVNKPPIYLTADPALLLPAASRERVREILVQEGVNMDRPLMGISICIADFWQSDKELEFLEFKKVIAQGADHMVTKGFRVVFVPFYKEFDREIAEGIVDIMRYKREAHIINGYYYTPQEVKGLLGRMDLVLGMRFHACIFAATMCVPLVGIMYAQKVADFLKTIGQEKRAVEVHNLSTTILLMKLDEAWKNRNRIRKELKEKVKLLEDRALLNDILLSEILYQKRN